MPQHHDTIVIGAGQTGLVMSQRLRERNREHVVLERARVAERWRTERWDSLCFQLPNRWLALPGQPYLGPAPDGFAHYAQVVKLIEDYASRIAAPVRTNVEVLGLVQDETSGSYLLRTSQGEMTARNVVIATGPFQQPHRVAFASAIPAGVQQVHASQYRNPSALGDGAVLVVGSGNSGCQIADELLRAGRHVFLAVSRHTRVPRRYRGKDIIWWYDTLGHFDVEIDKLPERKYPPTTVMTGVGGGYDLSPRGLGQSGVQLIGRVVGTEGGSLVIAGDAEELLHAAERSHDAFTTAANARAADPAWRSGFSDEGLDAEPGELVVDDRRSLSLSGENIRTIIWANGFDFGFDWVKLPVIDGRGQPVQKRGVTASPGVFFLGLHWMHNFRSAILPFVERDAAYIADKIALRPA